MTHHTRHGVSAVLITLLLGGCGAAPVSMPQWKSSLERHINDVGNGDFTEICPSSPDPCVFALHTDNHPRKSNDIAGVFVGLARVETRTWLVFLASTITKGRIKKIQVVAMSPTGTGHQWRLGEAGSGALELYQTSHRPRNSADDLLWPAPDDAFKLEMDGANAVVTELRSGAQWQLTLAHDP